jgi:hypothetical protein
MLYLFSTSLAVTLSSGQVGNSLVGNFLVILQKKNNNNNNEAISVTGR